ncbi:MAG: hypothetical protein H7Z19_06165 [Chitinophagaceae bacterium]|nr:hypothetical protein [Rubrivivax sp.]
MNRRQFHLCLAAALPGLAMAQADGSGDWFVFLETGRPTPDDKAAVAAMQRGHLDNFKRLFADKKLLAAGPLRDPSRVKRGIVVVKAASREELLSYFQPDAYVRDGYMTANAVPARANQSLHSEGIDPEGIEEVRIVLIGRDSAPVDAATAAARQTLLQSLLAQGRVGAWYTLHMGPVAEVLFARTTDTPALQAALASYAGRADPGLPVEVWSQWLGKGVLR